MTIMKWLLITTLFFLASFSAGEEAADSPTLNTILKTDLNYFYKDDRLHFLEYLDAAFDQLRSFIRTQTENEKNWAKHKLQKIESLHNADDVILAVHDFNTDPVCIQYRLSYLIDYWNLLQANIEKANSIEKETYEWTQVSRVLKMLEPLNNRASLLVKYKRVSVTEQQLNDSLATLRKSQSELNSILLTFLPSDQVSTE